MATASFSLYHILWFFIIYSVVGWCVEVVFCSANTGKFVNRGFLNGPVCPIYGFGATAVVYLLSPLQNNLLLLFVGSVLLTSLLELATGALLKKLFHTRWWDYSDQPFNIGGYICLKFSLAWGFACVFVVKLVHPLFAGAVDLLPRVLGIVLLALFYALLLCDFAVTLAAMLKLNRDLGEISRVAGELHKHSEAMAEGLGNTAISVAGKIEELDLPAHAQKAKEQWDEGREWMAATVEQQKGKLETTLEEQRQKWEDALDTAPLREKLDVLLGRNPRIRSRLMRAFPKAQSPDFPAALEQLRQRFLPTARGDQPADDTPPPAGKPAARAKASPGQAKKDADSKH